MRKNDKSGSFINKLVGIKGDMVKLLGVLVMCSMFIVGMSFNVGGGVC